MKVIQLNEGRIYKTDEGVFVISQNECWLEGSYETQEAAELALKHAYKDDCKFLGMLRDEINIKQDRSITVEDLNRALRGDQ